jgi:hypothetical protein
MRSMAGDGEVADHVTDVCYRARRGGVADW